jgi:uroporphyrinogen decarboxylase
MTSRERVLATLSHREPDRVPIDLGGSRVTSINPLPYTRLREVLGLHGEPARVIDVWQMLVWMEQPVVERLGIDVLPVPRLVQDFGMRIDSFVPWSLDPETPVQMPGNFAPVRDPDGSLCLYLDGVLVGKKAPSSPYFDRMIELKVNDPLPPIESIPMRLFGDDDLAWRRRWATTLRAETDKAIVGEFGPILGRWGSYQEWLLTVAADPDYVRSFNERKAENLVANAKLYREAVGDSIDIVWLGEDYGTQTGLMLRPEVFDSLVAPYYRRFFDWIHENTGWKILFHCCGGIYPIIPTLIDIGVDILNPVQVEAAGMEAGRLKREFGERLVFWGGGIDTQGVLPFGTREEIRAQVHDRIRTFGPGGGFVFTPSHNIQGDVPCGNIVAMYDAVREFGRYPLA